MIFPLRLSFFGGVGDLRKNIFVGLKGIAFHIFQIIYKFNEIKGSKFIDLLDEFLHWFLLNNSFLNSIIAAQKRIVDLIGWHLILKRMVQHVLSGGVLLDGLDVSWNGNAQVLKLDGDWGQRFDHFSLV